jgi:zinc D-Ala-D-Ala carboxypeptidase
MGQKEPETPKHREKEEKVVREKLSKNFYRDEFACKCGCGDDKIDKKLVSLLQEVRSEFGYPMRLTSSKRCAKHNKAVGGVEHSAHLYGFASDIYCKDVHLRYRLLPILFSKFKRLGVYSDFIHVDVDHSKPNPVCW